MNRQCKDTIDNYTEIDRVFEGIQKMQKKSLAVRKNPRQQETKQI